MLAKEIINKDTEAQIMEAAKTVFLKKGLAGARMQKIADAAGIGRTALHYYFRSKEKLFQVVWKSVFRDIGERTSMLKNNNFTTIEKMQSFVDGYFNKAMEEPELDIFILNEFNNNPEMMREILTDGGLGNPAVLLLDSVEASVKKGEMKGDPNQILITMISMCIFSFAGRVMLQNMLLLTDRQYMDLMKERRDYLKDFLKTAFKP